MSTQNDPTEPIKPAAEPATTAAAAPAAEPTGHSTGAAYVPAAAPAPRDRWYRRRVPLLATGAALILGCLLGGGVVGVTALIADHGDRGRPSVRDDRRGPDGGPGGRAEQGRHGPGGDDRRGGPPQRDDRAPGAPAPSAPAAPVPSAPAPTVSS